MNEPPWKTKIPEVDPYLTEVGRIASAWAMLEFHIDLLIWELIEVEHMLGACVTSQLTNVGARLRTLAALVRLREGSAGLIKEINSFDGVTAIVQQKRNRAVHDTWMYNRARKSAAQVNVTIAEKQLKFGINDVAMPELTTIHAEVKRHVEKFLKLSLKIRKELLRPSSSQKWRSQLQRMSAGFPAELSSDTAT